MSSTSVAPTSTQTIPEESAQDVNISAIRATKRKLDDAFQTLDNAVANPQAQRPSPPKKTNVNRTLYSTLAKYGIGSKQAQSKDAAEANIQLPSSISVPHLKAILTRAATRSKGVLPFKFSSGAPPPELPPTAEYRPSSIPAFLSRLSTFKLATYSQKPAAVDAVAAAKAGWTNEGKDRLVCGLCKASWVVVGTKGMGREAANVLLEKQRNSLVQQHKEGCPWKVRQCDSNIYRIPLQTPSNMVRDLTNNAKEMDPVLKNVETKHPLNPAQLKSLRAAVRSYESTQADSPEENNSDSNETNNEDANPFTEEGSSSPSDVAIVTSLLGWSIAPPAPAETQRRLPSSRASSVAPGTPPLSRASSVRPSTPVPVPATAPPGGPRPTDGTSSKPRFPSFASRAASSSFSFRMPLSTSASTSAVKRENTLLHCKLCQRRVGLWAFTNLSTPAEPLSASRSGSPAPSVAPSEDGDTSMADVSMGDVSMDTSTSTATPSRFSFMGSISAPIPRRSTGTPQPPKPFDLLKEHRSYCPYVVRSTTVPSLPLPPSSNPAENPSSGNAGPPVPSNTTGDNAIEGWRAVLTVILRYGLGQQYRVGLNYTSPEDVEASMEMDNVNFMVNSVKSRGGKDLLQYVKGLLG